MPKSLKNLLLAAVSATVLGACALERSAALAQENAAADFVPLPPMTAPALDHPELALLDIDGENREQWERFFGQLIVRNVTQPALYPFKKDAENEQRDIVVILPGGGYNFISIENEGVPVAQRLVFAGYDAYVLKYRTQVTPRTPAGFLQETGKVFRKLGKERLPDFAPAVDDLFRALEVVCAQYGARGCEGRRVNVIGFSAGARTIIRALEDADRVLNVDHVALIYPPMLDAIKAVSDVPVFLAIAQDDPLFEQGGFKLASSWIASGRALEMHLYHSGGHGFGTRESIQSSASWLDAYENWLIEQHAVGER